MKILFKVFPQKSHFNATFPFARELKAQGHEVIYAGLAPMRSHAETQGFDYYVQDKDIYPHFEQRRGVPALTFWSLLRNWRHIRRQAKATQPVFAAKDHFGKLIDAIKPEIILVDSPYTFFALSLYQHKIPFAILESMMNLDRAPGCPPLDTTYVPKNTRLSRIICELHWRRYFLKRSILGLVGVRMDYNRRFVLKTAGTFGVNRSVISFDRYFHIGLRNVPEIILSPRGLDFPRTPGPNQLYVNLPLNLERQEVANDYTFERRFVEFVEERKRGRSLVYCSLGTGAWRYKGAERFLHRVVEASRGRGWNLLMAIGNEFSLGRFRDAPENVAVFQTVPQLKVLRIADLMITHGGMNSITECAVIGVPMLVYPGTSEIDQAGNAARSVYHLLGLNGKMSSDAERVIGEKVSEILANLPTIGSSQFRQDIQTSFMRRNEADSMNILNRIRSAASALDRSKIPTSCDLRPNLP